MLLRVSTRRRGGKERRYFSVVENKRVSDGRVLQRHMLNFESDQLLAGVGVAPLAAFVRVEHPGNKWTLKLDECK